MNLKRGIIFCIFLVRTLLYLAFPQSITYWFVPLQLEKSLFNLQGGTSLQYYQLCLSSHTKQTSSLSYGDPLSSENPPKFENSLVRRCWEYLTEIVIAFLPVFEHIIWMLSKSAPCFPERAAECQDKAYWGHFLVYRNLHNFFGWYLLEALH